MSSPAIKSSRENVLLILNALERALTAEGFAASSGAEAAADVYAQG